VKKKPFVPKTRFTEDRCAICQEVLEDGIIISSKKKFSVTQLYSSGQVCEKCRVVLDQAVSVMEAGGCIVICPGCRNVGALPVSKAQGAETVVLPCPSCQAKNAPHDEHP
jgi:hypothetical protein